MIAPSFNCNKFKLLFPYFNEFECSDIELRWELVEFYLPAGICFEDTKAFYLWGLVTAHILYLDQLAQEEDPNSSGMVGGIVKSASAGDTSVTYEYLTAGDSNSNLDVFLRRSDYGIRALTVLNQERLTDIFALESNPICGRAI